MISTVESFGKLAAGNKNKHVYILYTHIWYLTHIQLLCVLQTSRHLTESPKTVRGLVLRMENRRSTMTVMTAIMTTTLTMSPSSPVTTANRTLTVWLSSLNTEPTTAQLVRLFMWTVIVYSSWLTVSLYIHDLYYLSPVWLIQQHTITVIAVSQGLVVGNTKKYFNLWVKKDYRQKKIWQGTKTKERYI